MLYVSELLDDGRYAITDTKDGVTEPVDFDTLTQLRAQKVKVIGLSSCGTFAYPVVPLPNSNKFTYIGRKVGEPVFDAVLHRVYKGTFERVYSENKLYTGNISGVSYTDLPDGCVLVLVGNDDGLTFCSLYGQVLRIFGDGRYELRLFTQQGTQNAILRCVSSSTFDIKAQVYGYIDMYSVKRRLLALRSDSNTNYATKRSYDFMFNAVSSWLGYLERIGLGDDTQINAEEALHETRYLIALGKELVWFNKSVVRPFSEVARELGRLFVSIDKVYSTGGANVSPFYATYGEVISDCVSGTKCNSILAFLTDLFFPTDSDSLMTTSVTKGSLDTTGNTAEEVFESVSGKLSGVLNFRSNDTWVNPLISSSYRFEDYVSASVYLFRSKVYTGVSSYSRTNADLYVDNYSSPSKSHSALVHTLSGVYEVYHDDVMDFIGKGAVGDAAVLKDLAKMKMLTGVSVSMNSKRVVTQLSVDNGGCLRFPEGGKTVNSATVHAHKAIRKVVIPSGYTSITPSFLARGEDNSSSWENEFVILNKAASYKPAYGIVSAITGYHGASEEFEKGVRKVIFSSNGNKVSSLMAIFLFKDLSSTVFLAILKSNLDWINEMTQEELDDFEAKILKTVLKNGEIASKLTFKNSNLSFSSIDFVNYLKLPDESLNGCRALMTLCESQALLNGMSESLQDMFSRLFKALTDVTDLMVDHVIRKAVLLGWYDSSKDVINFVNTRKCSTQEAMDSVDVGVSTWSVDDDGEEW